jgi:hypothetical protein
MLYSEKVSSAFEKKVKEICKDLGIKPDWLMLLMYFETASTFRPSIQNPTTNATGLIQFMPSTARGLGTTVEALKMMDSVEQLDWVKKYLNQYPVNLAKSYGELYLAVFYPLALRKGDSFVLGSQNGTSGIVARQNPIFDKDGNGEITKADVVEYQNNEAKEAGLSAGLSAKFDTKMILWGVGAIALIIIIYYLYKKIG